MVFHRVKMVIVLAHFGKVPFMTWTSTLSMTELRIWTRWIFCLLFLRNVLKRKCIETVILMSVFSSSIYIKYIINILRFFKKEFSALQQITVRLIQE